MINTDLPLRTAFQKICLLEPFITLILVFASGFYTYRGVLALTPDPSGMDKSAALVFAVAVTAALFYLWRAIQLQVPELEGPRLALSPLAIFTACCFAVGVSSYANFVGMVGDQALGRQLANLPIAYTAALNTAKEAVQRGLAPAGDIKGKLAAFEAMLANDLQHGGSTGIVGKGPFVAHLEAIIAALKVANQAADAKTAQATSLTAAAAAQLEQMRQDVSSNKPASERADAVKADVERIQLTLGDLVGIDLTNASRQAAAAAGDASAGGANTPAFTALAQEVAAWAKRISDEAAARKVAALAALPGTMPTVYAATLAEALNFIPQLLASILVDLLPLPALLLKLLVIGQLRAMEKDKTGIEHRLSYAEVQAVQRLLASPEGAPEAPVPANSVAVRQPSRRPALHAVAEPLRNEEAVP